MKSTLKFFIVAVAIQMLAACGSVNTITYYAPNIESVGVPTQSARDGIAFSIDGICLHVSEAGIKSIQPRAMTLVGVPLIPISLSADEYHASYFDVALWLIPEQGNTAYTFDIPRIELELNNGTRVQPRVIQVSRFMTQFEKERVYAFKPDIIETISYPEHWGVKPIGDFHKPIELWDWTRLTMRFEKPAAALEPAKLYVLGLLRSGTTQEVPVIGFSLVSDTRQAFPGRFADGTSITDEPDRACRRLQKRE